MELLLLILLMLIIAALLSYGVYLLTLLFKAYMRLKRLTAQRDYEIMLYAALPSSSVDDMARLIPDDTDKDVLATVLERIANQNQGDLREKAIQLYRLKGLYDMRRREVEKGKPRKKALALQKLESLGLPVRAEPSGEEAPAADTPAAEDPAGTEDPTETED